MIEKIVLDYLASALSVPVYMEIPQNPPPSFVIIEKTASGMENRVYSATFALQSYAGSMYAAALLNEDVKAAMDEMAASTNVGSARLNSDYNFTDTATKRYRYQAVYNLSYV